MKVLVFKTNIQNLNQVESIRIPLNNALGFREWNIDLEDCDKVLRVEVTSLDAKSIIELVKSLGFICEDLET